MRLFPGGKNEDSQAYIGLFLHLTDAISIQFKVKYRLGVVGKETVFAEAENNGEAFKSGWGYHKLMMREKLCDPNKDFLKDGKLVLFCEVSMPY